MEIGLVEKVNIDDEMQQAYLDYAMSVIVARALPDARDGLKPVHRRILYAMYDMGLRPETAYKKSARIVGEVLGKYHPHGDMAVYEAMARMAQSFSMRYSLVDGQGNFGSVDGDSPAAMRYTEARMAPPAMNMLADIQKNTVNFSDNFDGTLTEPEVLPAAIPNLLVNGATGIAVGMSTSIPPHNLGEVVDALKYMLENWNKLDDVTVEDLMQFIQGPDFPTGGVILQEAQGDGLQGAYGSGRGRVTVQARARLEEMDRGRNRIIVTELPYMTNKASLIEKIAELVRDEKLEGIADLRDESDRQGMRIVIELSRSADPEKVLQSLYKYTPMQSTFSLILLALVDGEPRLLSLKQALRVYLDHRLEIVRRRSEYDLEKARQRAHILEGLRVALKNLDEVIDIIRKAPDVEAARERLRKRFKLTDIQTQAILDMQLRRLAALERKKIDQEYKEVQAQIKELESLLRSPARMRNLIADELQAVKEAYGDGRRTSIVYLKDGEKKVSLLTVSDLTPKKMVWVAISPEGLIARTPEDKLPRMSGNDAPAWVVRANSHDTLFLVDGDGETAAISVHQVPEKPVLSEGVPITKIAPLHSAENLAAVFTLPPKGDRREDWFVLTVTRQGMVKKSALVEVPGPSGSLFTLVKVNEGDRVGWLRLTNGQAEVLLVTRQGMAIRFSEEEVRPMGLAAAGVMGIKLQDGDEVAGMEVLPRPGMVFLIASDGSAKRVALDQFPTQGRYGQGVIAWKLPAKVQVAGLAVGKGTARVTIHVERLAPKSIRMDAAPEQSRTARGAPLDELKGDTVKSITVPWSPPRPDSGESEADVEDEPDGNGGEPAGAKPLPRSQSKPAQRSATGDNGRQPKRGTARGANTKPGAAADGKSPAAKGKSSRAARAGSGQQGTAADNKASAAQKPVSTRGTASRQKTAGAQPASKSRTRSSTDGQKTSGTQPASGRKTSTTNRTPASGTPKPAAGSKTASGQSRSRKAADKQPGQATEPKVKTSRAAASGQKTASKSRAGQSSGGQKSAAAQKPAAGSKTAATKSRSSKPAGTPAEKKPAAGTKSTQAASGREKAASKSRAGQSSGGQKTAAAQKPAAGSKTAATKSRSSKPAEKPAEKSTKPSPAGSGTGRQGTVDAQKPAGSGRKTGAKPTSGASASGEKKSPRRPGGSTASSGSGRRQKGG